MCRSNKYPIQFFEEAGRMKKLFAFIFLFSALPLFFAGCGSQNEAELTTDTQIYTVQKGTIANQITATGYLEMPNQAKLTFGASGTVDEILVDIGNRVASGQVLAKLDEVTLSGLQQSLLQAQIDVKTAQMNLDNAKEATTSASGATMAPDPLDIESKELALERANLNLNSAQRELDGAVITAPWDGWVAEVNSLVGDKVSTSTVVMRLIDTDIMTVDTLVNETDIFNVELGAPATITVVALSNLVLPASVTNISPSATISGGVVNYTVRLKVTSVSSINTNTAAGTQNMPMTGNMPQNFTATSDNQSGNTRPGFSGSSNSQSGLHSPPANIPSGAVLSQSADVPTLKEGLSVDITLVISEKDNVLIIPSRAITREGINALVQVYVDEENTEKRAITTGISDWENTEVTDGLAEGEKIVITRAVMSTSQQNTGGSPMGGMPPMGVMPR